MDLTDRVSLEQFLEFPEEKPYREYLYGRVVSKSLPKYANSQLQAQLAFHLEHWNRRSGSAGEVLTEQRCVLSTAGERHVQLPDVAWFRKPLALDAGNATSPPTLAVEVLSEGDSFSRLQRKIRIYLDAGVALLWIVDPEERTVSVYRKSHEPVLLENLDTLHDPLLPGFQLTVAELFSVP